MFVLLAQTVTANSKHVVMGVGSAAIADCICGDAQLVWVCLPGDHYGLALHIILLLRLFRMIRVFSLMKVSFCLQFRTSF